MMREFNVRRVLELLIGGGLAWLSFTVLDSRRASLGLSWVLVAVGISSAFVAAGAAVRLIRVAVGMEDIEYFPARVELKGRRGLLTLMVVGAILIAVAAAASRWLPGPSGKIALGAGGLFVCFLGAVRPRAFWDSPSVADLREFIGDTATSVVVAAAGLALLVTALLV